MLLPGEIGLRHGNATACRKKEIQESGEQANELCIPPKAANILNN